MSFTYIYYKQGKSEKEKLISNDSTARDSSIKRAQEIIKETDDIQNVSLTDSEFEQMLIN